MSKVEKIKAEIERLKSELIQEAKKGYKSEFDEGRISAFEDMIVYIDSLSDTEKDFGIKESVIPFGASDSELMEATYFIPQGYHAVIDGNKVIIKKGEEPISNDLKEAAIEAFKQIVDSDKNSFLEIFKAGAEWGMRQAEVKIQAQSTALTHGCPKEFANNDLEEAAHSYVDTTIEWFDPEGNPCCYPAFKAGAQWQKEQMIEKAWNWIEDNLLSSNQQDKSRLYFEQFKNYIKE